MMTSIGASILAGESELHRQFAAQAPPIVPPTKGQVWADTTNALLTALQFQQARCAELIQRLEVHPQSSPK